MAHRIALAVSSPPPPGRQDDATFVAEWLSSFQEMIQLFLSTQRSHCLPHFALCVVGSGALPRGRSRNLLPLPALAPLASGAIPELVLTQRMTDCIISGLNYLYGARTPSGTPIAAQLAVHERLMVQSRAWIMHLAKHRPLTCRQAFDDFLGADAANVDADGTSGGRPPFNADGFDLLNVSGRVDVLKHLSPDIAATVSRQDLLFPCLPKSAAHYPPIAKRSEREYARLVGRQLRCRKVDLAFNVSGGGTIFSIAKREYREVCHGALVSSYAVDPPPPRHLLSPTSLLSLECSLQSPLVLSKRDGRCLFDQLRLPTGIRRCMGRPPVRAALLADAGGFTLDELDTFLCGPGQIQPRSLLYPRSCVWPMGFCWSSFIAQEVMLSVCTSAGFTESTRLADSLPSPTGTVAHGLATDDIVVFTRAGDPDTPSRLKRLDRAFVAHDILRHEGKDVNEVLNGTAVGVDLCHGTHLRATSRKAGLLVLCLEELLRTRQISPLRFAALLGHIQWFNLLARQLFSILDVSYTFARHTPQRTTTSLPDAVVAELALVAALAPLWCADLTRVWSDTILASDASQSFGFGLARWRGPRGAGRRMGRFAEKRGDYITLQTPNGEGTSLPDRIGTPHKLSVPQSRFGVLISARARHQSHASVLEAHALRLALEWLGRAARHHNRRQVILVDAKAVLGAAVKGRTSSRALRLQLRRLAALQLATHVALHLLYIPSEHNPSDHPSRGVPIPP